MIGLVYPPFLKRNERLFKEIDIESIRPNLTYNIFIVRLNTFIQWC